VNEIGTEIGNFEIGRILHFKSEIGKLKSDFANPEAWRLRNAESDLSFPISDLKCRIRPISKFPVSVRPLIPP
jgi:hypothetical protein